MLKFIEIIYPLNISIFFTRTLCETKNQITQTMNSCYSTAVDKKKKKCKFNTTDTFIIIVLLLLLLPFQVDMLNRYVFMRHKSDA